MGSFLRAPMWVCLMFTAAFSGHHMSKAANNMMAKLVSLELQGKAAVAILHPGFNRTEMTKKYEAIWDIEGAVDPSGLSHSFAMNPHAVLLSTCDLGLTSTTFCHCCCSRCQARPPRNQRPHARYQRPLYQLRRRAPNSVVNNPQAW